MSNVKIRALDSFTHGRLSLERGQKATLNNYDAEDLVKVGLVEIVGESDDLDDLVGGKMAPLSGNKMQSKADNKMAPKSDSNKSDKNKF